MPNLATHFDKTAVLVDGETRLLGLIGQGIGYTKSPAIHNCAMKRMNFNGVYVPFDVAAENVAGLLETLWGLGAVGMNVTTPHKERVASLITGHGFQAVNTLYRGPEGWLATSTDGLGFANGLERISDGLNSFRQIVLLGSGGVVVSILEHIKKYHTGDLEQVVILRRSVNSDKSLQALVAEAFPLQLQKLDEPHLAALLKGRGKETLLVQGTSAPHHGDRLEHLVPALTSYKGVVVDLVYGKPSALYDAAIAKDLVAQDGEAMLIEQARAAQKIWFGQSAEYENLALALRGK